MRRMLSVLVVMAFALTMNSAFAKAKAEKKAGKAAKAECTCDNAKGEKHCGQKWLKKHKECVNAEEAVPAADEAAPVEPNAIEPMAE